MRRGIWRSGAFGGARGAACVAADTATGALAGRETKKGLKGTASNYIHRTKAVRRLQVSLKDFRRLCILKGIYPREPKRKPNGSDKTYYHIKDIKFLMHEPLLQKFRAMKVFLKRKKKALTKRDYTRAEALETTMRPDMSVDHLVRERYPSFVDAIRDLDDPLCMLFLFSRLPAGTCKQHEAEVAAGCLRLAREFQHWVLATRALRKTFVSIKGIYYQARVYGQDVTWLVPHALAQTVPRDVDFRVMLTFLDFYTTMLRFVNFKLYHDIGLKYPPTLDESKDNSGAYLDALTVEKTGPKVAAPESTDESSLPKPKGRVNRAQRKEMQERVWNAVGKLDKGGDAEEDDKDGEGGTAELNAEASASEDDNDDDEDGQNEEEEAFPASGIETLDAKEIGAMRADPAAGAPPNVFSGLVVLLGRSVPRESLEFVVRAGGGRVVMSDTTDAKSITHHVIDRPTVSDRVQGRVYVQPQWVYDSFNVRALLPDKPYAPGTALPPHLSPFVDDDAEGYVPKQREVLRSWGGKVGGAPPAPAEDGSADQDTAAAASRKRKGTEASEEDEEDDEKERAELMMNNKTKRLYTRIMAKQKKKDDFNETLRKKRRRIEADSGALKE